MRILHISDFHFSSSAKDIAAQKLLIDKLVDNLQEGSIDFLIFSGDLVFSGSQVSDFKQAYQFLLERVGKRLGLRKRDIIICPGNHDVDRNAISLPVKDFFRKISSSEALEKLVNDKREDIYGISLKPTSNYRQFEKEFYSKGVDIKIDNVGDLCSTHVREYANFKIGFVCINTAWCSTGDDDKDNLLFPKSEIEKAIFELNEKQVNWKILVLHHPLTDLREFNKTDIEDLIYTEFHFMFSGHLHKRDDFVKLTQNEGIFGSYAHAAFTKKNDGKIGYSIINIDLETLDVILQKYLYDFEERSFFALKEMNFTFPCNEAKSKQIKIFKTLRKRVNEICSKADEICITTKEKSPQKGFLDLFVNPVLKKQPQYNISTTLSQARKIEYSSLMTDKNFLIFGKDKTGKTSLLLKLTIDLLNGFSQLGEIPFYIDLSIYKDNYDRFDILKLFSLYIEHTKNQTSAILKQYKFKLIFDNFDPSNAGISTIISKFLSSFPNGTYVMACDQTLAHSYEKFDYGLDGYEKLFIHDISRSEIRQLTNKWPSIPSEKKEEFTERIISVLKQHSMPFNFWTLSIFLWIFSGKKTLNFNSNSELLEIYIDDILDRNMLASNPQNRFSYSNYKLLLAELAFELLKSFLSTNYSMKYSELIQFTEDFKKKNIRRVGRTSDIVSHLLERGILTMLDNDYVTFRLNGVFEYFIAFNFIENKVFLNEVISNDALYLSFKNEFEIYSGFQRTESENAELLKKIFSKTQTAFGELNERLQGDVDFRLNENIKSNNLLDLSKPISEIATRSDIAPLSGEEKDELFEEMSDSLLNDDIEVKPKKVYDVSIKKFEILERYLLINSRVFKNIENINDVALVEKTFEFLLDATINLGFLLVEEMEHDIDNVEIAELDYSNTNKIIFQIISNYLPTVVQAFLFDAIGHINLEGMIIRKIDSLKPQFRKNQFKLFILYSLLLDIDLKKHKNRIDEMLEMLKMSIIKSSLIAKLFSLLLLKSYDDDRMIAFLKEKIRTASLDLNPKTDMSDFEKKFDNAKKLMLLKRQIEK